MNSNYISHITFVSFNCNPLVPRGLQLIVKKYINRSSQNNKKSISIDHLKIIKKYIT